MKFTHTAISLLIFSSLLSCGSSDKRPAGHIEEERQAAIAQGRKQALRLAMSECPDSLEMEKILIDVRVTENTLRREGEEGLADNYVESFLATLDSVNPDLYADITSPL